MLNCRNSLLCNKGHIKLMAVQVTVPLSMQCNVSHYDILNTVKIKVKIATFTKFIGLRKIVFFTGKSLSEALLFAEHGENMLCTKSVLNGRNNFCTQHVLPRFELGIFMH